MEIEKMERLYELHKTYKKHEYKDFICECGSIQGLFKFNTLLERIKVLSEGKTEEYIDALLKINSHIKEDLLCIFLKITDNYEKFKEKAQKENIKFGLDKIDPKYYNQIFLDDLFVKDHKKYFEENWEKFEHKEKFLKRFVFDSSDITSLLKDDEKILSKVKFNKRNYYYSFINKANLEEVIPKLYLLFKNNPYLQYKPYINLNTFQEIILAKRLFLATKINFELAVQMFVQTFNKLPNEIADYPSELDSKVSKEITFKEINPEEDVNSVPSNVIFYNNKLLEFEMKK